MFPILEAPTRKAYLKKNRGCEKELHERLEKKLPNFWNRRDKRWKLWCTNVHFGSLHKDRPAFLFYCKAQLGKRCTSLTFQRDKGKNTLTWRLFKGKTHGRLGQQECCSTSRESVGGGRSHPKCWGICRERLRSWKSPPVTKCYNILVGIAPVLLSAQANQDAGCKHACAALNNEQWVTNSFHSQPPQSVVMLGIKALLQKRTKPKLPINMKLEP